MPISWQSRSIKRAVKSTQAAKTLAMLDMADTCIYYRKFFFESLGFEDVVNNIPVVCKADNSSVCKSAHLSTQILDERLRIERAILCEMLINIELSGIKWVLTSHQIADSLTRQGVLSSKILLHIMEPKEYLT